MRYILIVFIFLVTLPLGEAQVISEADNAASALRKMERQLPDILITDLSMPNKNGFELITDVTHKPFGL